MATIAAPDYRTLAPEIVEMVDAGIMSQADADELAATSLLLVGFLVTEAARPEIRQMFEANDREHFIDGLQNDPSFTQRFGLYLAQVKGL